MPRKTTIKGGAIIPWVRPIWTPYIMLWLAMAVFAACIFLVVSHAPWKPEVRVVVVEKTVDAQTPVDRPPVYPQKAPMYPQRNVAQSFQQIGVLVSQDANEDQPVILPLFGRKMTTRDRWEYYVASDKFHLWRLPVQHKNRMCDDDTVGCEEIYQGDEVVVPDYANKVFLARIYKYAPPTLSNV